MSKLHLFDMDGTLLSGSACLDISRHLGQIEAVNDIEARWSLGAVGHVEFYELCLPLWAGLTEADVDAVFDATGWLEGIEDVWRDIAARGEHSAVITLSPQFFADRLLAWGVGSAHGAGVRAAEALDPTRVMTPAMKVAVARALMDEHGLAAVDCVAYGDSSSDVPLFEFLSHSVAVNGTASLRALAARHYQGRDLRGAYRLARELLDPEPQPARHR